MVTGLSLNRVLHGVPRVLHGVPRGKMGPDLVSHLAKLQAINNIECVVMRALGSIHLYVFILFYW